MLKGVNETIQNVAKEQKGGFLSMLLGTLGASLLGNTLAAKGMNRAREAIIRAGYGSTGFLIQKKKIFDAASYVTNFEIQKYYQNELRFNGGFILQIIYLLK